MAKLKARPIPYDKFRTGLTFGQVRRELAARQHEQRRRGQYFFVTRRTVLGRMYQYKQELYERYLQDFESGGVTTMI